MTIAEKTGDALQLPESIKLETPYSSRRHCKRTLQNNGVLPVGFMYYNRGLFSKGLIVVVPRGMGAIAQNILVQAGYQLA